MRLGMKNLDFGSGIKPKIYILIGGGIILWAFTISFIFWQSSQKKWQEAEATRYHLALSNVWGRITEEVLLAENLTSSNSPLFIQGPTPSAEGKVGSRVMSRGAFLNQMRDHYYAIGQALEIVRNTHSRFPDQKKTVLLRHFEEDRQKLLELVGGKITFDPIGLSLFKAALLSHRNRAQQLEKIHRLNFSRVSAKHDKAEDRGHWLMISVLLGAVCLGGLVSAAVIRQTGRILRDQSETEKNLRDSEKGLASAQRIANIGSWEWNMASGILSWSNETYRIFGFNPQEFPPTLDAFLDAVHPDYRTDVRRAIDDTLETGEPYWIEHQVVRPDQEIRWVEEQGEVVKDDSGKPALMRGTVQDVTERKQASVENERQARIIEESLNEIFVFDAQTLKFIQVNLGARRNLGYSMDELKEMTAYDIKPDFPGDKFIETIKPLLDGTEERLVFETIHQRKNGSMYDVEVYLQLIRDRGGDAFVAIINDISRRKVTDAEIRDLNQSLEKRVRDRTQALEMEIIERRQTQELLRDSEERIRAVVNSAADGIITINQTGTITSFNAAAEKIFGYSVMEAMGKNVSILASEEHTDKHDGYIAHYLETGEEKVIGVGREVEGRRKDGSTFPMELAISIIEIAGTKAFTGIVRDISERREAEDKLRKTLGELRLTQNELVQSEKMASLGGLVAGVAHEINTPVGIGVTASTHLEETVSTLRNSMADGTMKKSMLETSLESIEQASKIIFSNLKRAAELIGSFKQVAVDQSSEERRVFLLSEYLDEILLSLRPNIKKTKHRIEIDCDPKIQINSYPGAISQVVTNLIMNSLIHAYEDGEEGTIRISAEASAGHAVIRYADDGMGMDEGHRKQIFDPFFTTKRGSGGSGLGMHILFNQVTQTLGGTVTCESAPGEGTSFEIAFPADVMEAEKNKASV